MLRKILVPLALLALALVAVVGANAASAQKSFALKGEVYPNYKIEMKNSAGRNLTTVKAGTYRIKIEDKSSIHDFHLKGPGVDKTTTVGGSATGSGRFASSRASTRTCATRTRARCTGPSASPRSQALAAERAVALSAFVAPAVGVAPSRSIPTSGATSPRG